MSVAVASVTPKLVKKSLWKPAMGLTLKVASLEVTFVTVRSKKRLMVAEIDTVANSCRRLGGTICRLETTTRDRGRSSLVAYCWAIPRLRSALHVGLDTAAASTASVIASAAAVEGGSGGG